MARYEATIKLPVSCANDGIAAKAVETLKRFLKSSVVQMALISYGITVTGEPDITVTKKKT